MIDPRNVAATARGLGLSIPKLLFAFIGAPSIWALHLGAIYFLQTLDCITRWDGGRWSIILATLALGAASAASGWTAWRMRRGLGGAGPDAEWARFLLVLGIGAGVLFTAVIVLEGLSPLLAPLCG
jgi:hypothetical protein